MKLLIQHPLYDCNTLVTVTMFLPIYFFVRLFHNSLSGSDYVALLMSAAAVLRLPVQACCCTCSVVGRWRCVTEITMPILLQSLISIFTAFWVRLQCAVQESL